MTETELKDSGLHRLDLGLAAPPVAFPNFRSFVPARQGAVSESLKWTNRYRRILLVADAVVIVSVLTLAHLIRFGPTQASVQAGNIALPYTLVSASIVVAWLGALSMYGSRDAQMVGHGVDEYKRVVTATVTLLGCLATVCLVFGVDISRGFFALAFPAGVLGLVLARWVLRQWLRAQRARGRYLFKVVVLGRPKDVKYVANQIQRKSGSGYRVVGVALTSTDGRPG